MAWAWQHPEWPEFTWRSDRFGQAEQRFLIDGGVFFGSIGHLDAVGKEQLTVEALSVEAMTTSEIEGEILDRASVQSSIRRQLGLDTDHRRVRAPEQGIAEMMVNLHRSFATPLSDDMLFAWHRMVTNGRTDLHDIGRYRRHTEPMQVVSGPVTAPRVHYEAPPSADVPREMARFIDWFNWTAPDGAMPLPPLTRAGIAHFYFECIHPFEDGNGRIGRALSEKVFSQSFGRPTLTALAATILAKRKAYYEALERNNRGIELTDWLAWFAAVAIEAQRRAAAMVEFLIDKTRLLDRLRGALNARQEKALLRVLREGPGGFEGGLTAGKYIAITGASIPTATRDLSDLVVKGALTRIGERRHTRYHVEIEPRLVRSIEIDEDGRIVEQG